MPTISDKYNEAERLKDEGKNDEAIAKLNEILAEDQSHALSHLALGVLYHQVGKPVDAVRHAELACEIEPDDPFNYTALSVTYQRAFQATQDQMYIRKAEEAMMRSHSLQH